MLGRTYEGENCSAARALEVVGERWSLLILRDAMFAGSRRFMEFQRSLGVASNILATRLDWLVASGLIETRASVNGDAHEYVLTEKGLDLKPVILALSAWGDRWSAPQGAPIVYRHEGCGGAVQQLHRCAACGATPHLEQIVATPGPGMRALPD